MKVKMSDLAVARSAQRRVPISSLRTAKKDSAAALSKQLPVRPMLCLSFNLLMRSRNWAEVYSSGSAVRVDDAARLQAVEAGGHVEGVDPPGLGPLTSRKATGVQPGR